MVGKIVKGCSPGRCAEYCLNHDDARILCWDGLDIDRADAVRLAGAGAEERASLARSMARNIGVSFTLQAETDPSVMKPVGHVPLCFMKEDAPLLDDASMTRIALEYLERMGYRDTQYMVVRHFNAKGNPHMHILFNRVGNDGRCLSSWQDYRRNADVCRAITERHGLHMSTGRGDTVVEDLHGRERVRYRISGAIDAALPGCSSIRELGNALGRDGITMQLVRRNDGTVQGVAFALAGDEDGNIYRFRGSEVGRRYTYGHLMERIGRGEEQCVMKGAMQRRQESHASRETLRDVAETVGAILSPAYGPSVREHDIPADAEALRRKKRRMQHHF